MEGLSSNSQYDEEGEDSFHTCDGDNTDGLDADTDDHDSAANESSKRRIFRSSLCGMFEESQSSKTDACAVFCCGIYLWQRNRDILIRDRRKEDRFGDDDNDDDDQLSSAPTSTSASTSASTSTSTPPLTTKTIYSTIAKRPLETSFLILVAVTVVVWAFDDPTTNHLFSTIESATVWLLIVCVIWKGFEFEQARKKLRQQLAISEYYRRRNRDTADTNDSEDECVQDLAAFLEQHKKEIDVNAAHDICGFARSDRGWFGSRFFQSNSSRETDEVASNVDEDDENDDDENNNSPRNNDLCSKAWNFLRNLCCGMLCGCHLQLFGICAIAQESRQLRDAFPTNARPGLWQRDYITMQPWTEYYPSILRLRLSNQIRCLPHFKALSKLSRQILLAAVAILMFVTLLFLLPIRFAKWQVLILYGTILQPAVFLFFVHWLWNRLDLSLDAVIKYFACGFFICTSSAIVYEWLVSKVAQKFIVLVNRLGDEGLELFEDHSHPLTNGDHDFDTRYNNEHPLWYQLTMATFSAFVNAFFVAGLTEEICKYLCFWMVEHPDLESQNKVMLAHRRETEQRYSEKSDHKVDTETTGLLVSQEQQQSASSPSPSDPEQQQVVYAPFAPLASIGEAITVAMITVALGFACAENLLYIFVYTSPGLSAEIDTLYVRCLFPIHPMTAALQSIEVCRRDLEKDKSVGIGRILGPAWLLHGAFDFMLMAHFAIQKILQTHHHKLKITHYYEHDSYDLPKVESGGEEPVDDDDDGAPFLVYLMAIPFIGVMYFLNESFHQRERLEQLDKENRRHMRSTNEL